MITFAHLSVGKPLQKCFQNFLRVHMHIEGKFSAWLSLAAAEQLRVEFKSNAFYFN